MKRLNLASFRAQQSSKNAVQMNQLLDQVLGNCHDRPSRPTVDKEGESTGA